MTAAKLREVFDEAGPDFSAEVCSKADMSDLDERAIEVFRKLWHKKSENSAILQMSQEQLLADAELVDDKPTYAALVLLGKHRALGRHLADAEVVFVGQGLQSGIRGKATIMIEHHCGIYTKNPQWISRNNSQSIDNTVDYCPLLRDS